MSHTLCLGIGHVLASDTNKFDRGLVITVPGQVSGFGVREYNNIYIYIYIYIHINNIHTYTYKYIYIYIDKPRIITLNPKTLKPTSPILNPDARKALSGASHGAYWLANFI